MSKTNGHFEIIKKTSFNDIVNGNTTELPESDLCFQNEQQIVQFKYVRPEEEKKYEIKPGVYNLVETSAGVACAKVELRDRPLLQSIDNTSRIIKEAKLFFSKLDVYERLQRPKKRAVLLYSRPGMGKSSAIAKFCSEFINEDPGTVVFNWPTSAIEADAMSKFLSTQSEYTSDCTRLILIMEDIGGGEADGDRGRSPVDSGMLNLLDGVGVTFKLPTFIVATTNHPENLLESLADRPGRFDLMLQLNSPSAEERIALMHFIAKREVTPEEKAAITKKGTEEFSIAHLEEIAVRSELHDKTYEQVVDELIVHSKRYKRGFEEERKMGLGLS